MTRREWRASVLPLAGLRVGVLAPPSSPAMLVALAALAALVALSAACPLDLFVPPGTAIQCDANADCPAPLLCATRARRCVDPSRLDDAPIQLRDVSLERSRMGRVPPHADNTLRFTVSQAAVHVAVSLAPPGGRAAALPVACAEETPGVVSCPFVTPAAAAEGDVGASWLWDGAAWTEVPGSQPPQRLSARLARHPGRQSVVLFGSGETWEFRRGVALAGCAGVDGRWAALETATTPPPRNGHGLVSVGDGADGTIFLALGSGDGDTWRLPTDAAVRPRVQVRFSIAAEALANTDAQLLGLRRVVHASGAGAVLEVWRRGRSDAVVAHDVTGFAPLAWSDDEPATIAQAIFGPAGDVTLALVPSAAGVRDGVAATVDVDAVALELRYRLP